MDDAIDEMQAAAKAIDLYERRRLRPEMKDMAAIIVDAARLMAEAMPLLRDIGRNGDAPARIDRAAGADGGPRRRNPRAGLKRAFKSSARPTRCGSSSRARSYKHLERIVDAFEDVANEIDGIVIDHA